MRVWQKFLLKGVFVLKEYVFENNLKLIYKKSSGDLTSVCISLDAGAGCEKKNFGTAHAVEHMVFKKTKNRNEKEINEILSGIFGFQNAMTNYPYVIYYGTLLGEDLEQGIDVLSDIVVNPVFTQKDFEDEMGVIKEELNEWDEELEQYCEDKLFLNTFEERRIKYPIIGTKESLDSLTLNDIKEFYEERYFPGNTSIAVVTSREFEEVKKVIEKYFGLWGMNDGQAKKRKKLESINYEMSNSGCFKDDGSSEKTCKVQIVCPIDDLNEYEMKCFRIFDQYFGVGVNSILFDELRTKNSLIYDVITRAAHENYIKLYKITFNTSKDKVETALNIIEKCIDNIEDDFSKLTDNEINKISKSFKLKRLFREEQSIILAKELATYETMFADAERYVNETEKLGELNRDDIVKTGIKVLKRKSIQIIEG